MYKYYLHIQIELQTPNKSLPYICETLNCLEHKNQHKSKIRAIAKNKNAAITYSFWAIQQHHIPAASSSPSYIGNANQKWRQYW